MTDPAAHTPGPSPLNEALRLANLGLRVLPIKPGQKRPPMTAWQNAATTDTTIITNWYTGLYADHGVGVATGQRADGHHLFVVDVDEHDPNNSGSETLHQLEHEHGPLPDTVEVQTGSGGRHLYYLSPHPVSNDAGRKLGPGLDIRGTGGQVLAPPTVHPNGRPYVWLIGHDPDDIPIAWAPTWLLDRLTTPAPTPAPAPASTRTSTRTVWDTLADDGPAARYNDTTRWADLLTADGWTHAHTSPDGEQHWTRPGKTTREGTSATVGYNGQDVLVVFTSSIPWLPEGAYSRFGYYACRHHHGDRSAAARQLRQDTTSTLTIAYTPPEPAPAPDSAESTADSPQAGVWPDPIPLIEHTQVPAFPTRTLPDWINAHAQQIADDLQVAVDLPATLALGALSVAAIGKAKITYPRQRWTQPLNLYAAVALPPSAGKSPAKNAMFGALEQLELRRLEQAAHARAQADMQRRILEKKQKNLEDKAAKGGDDGRAAEFELLDLVTELARLDHTPSGRLLVDDATTEALGVALADAGGHIAVVSAEGGIFDRIAGLYNDGAANLDLYLEGWGGGRYVVDRIKRDSISIPSANLVVITTVQPATLDEIGARKQFAGRGLTARFLLCLPPSNVGGRNRLRPSTGDELTRRTYEAHLTDLADRIHTHGAQLTVGQEASDRFAHWDQNLEDRLAPGQDLEHLAEWVGKLRANVLRLAALLHLAHRQPGDHIDDPTMIDAIALGDYYLAHAIAIADRWGIDGDVVLAKKLIEWATRNGHDRFTVREVMRALHRQFTSIEQMRPAVTKLLEHGWIRPEADGPVVLDGSRGRPSAAFIVHPDAHALIHSTPSVSTGVYRKSVDNPSNSLSVSTVSTVSHKEGNVPLSLSQKETPTPAPDPGDTVDTVDTLNPTRPDQTEPDDPTGLFN